MQIQHKFLSKINVHSHIQQMNTQTVVNKCCFRHKCHTTAATPTQDTGFAWNWPTLRMGHKHIDYGSIHSATVCRRFIFTAPSLLTNKVVTFKK